MSASNYGGTGLSLAELEALPMVEVDARLAGAIAATRSALAFHQSDLAEAESLLRERMQGRGATMADCGPYEARLELARRYEYDLEALASLQAHLDVDAYERAVKREVVEVVKVDKRELNRLAKLGGEVARIIAASTTEVAGAPRLVLEKRAAP